jgi:hypothetical protein
MLDIEVLYVCLITGLKLSRSEISGRKPEAPVYHESKIKWKIHVKDYLSNPFSGDRGM